MARPTSLTVRADERRKRVAELARQNIEDAAIAERLGMSASRVAVMRREAGIKLRAPNSLEPEVIAEIHRRLNEDEWPPGEISATLGINPSTVLAHTGPTKTGPEWNKVARWAAKNHQALWEELKR